MSEIREVPWSRSAEAAVLAAMMIDPQAVGDVRATVSEQDFFRSANQAVFGALLRLHDTGRATDVVSLTDELRAAGRLEQAGGVDYVATLVDEVPNATSAGTHAGIVRDRARLRRFIAACQLSIEDAYEAGSNAEPVFRDAEARLLGLTEPRRGSGFRAVGDAVHDGLEMIDRAARAKGGVLGLPTSLPTLDRMLGGFEPGLLTVLAARPSMGKSALGWIFAERAAKYGAGVAVASYEMSAGQLARRALAKSTGIGHDRVRRGDLSADDWRRVSEAGNRISALPIWIDEHPAETIEALRADVRRLSAKAPLQLVVVDYLQQMRGQGQNRNNEVEHISRGLKRMARDLNVHVLALAQLSRAVEHRSPPRPMLSDLRDSGAVEQDADIVLLLWRPERYFDEKTPEQARQRWTGKGELIVGKQRDGETGRIVMAWNDSTLSFHEPTTKPEQQELLEEQRRVQTR